jgi:hypothetical protein
MLVFCVVTLCGLVGATNVAEEHIADIFRASAQKTNNNICTAVITSYIQK